MQQVVTWGPCAGLRGRDYIGVRRQRTSKLFDIARGRLSQFGSAGPTLFIPSFFLPANIVGTGIFPPPDYLVYAAQSTHDLLACAATWVLISKKGSAFFQPSLSNERRLGSRLYEPQMRTCWHRTVVSAFIAFCQSKKKSHF